MDNVDLTAQQIEQDLKELIEESEDKVNQQGSEMVICDSDDSNSAKKDPKTKKSFVALTKVEFEKLGKREQFEYKIGLSKYKTDQLKEEFKDYKSKQNKSTRSLETKKLIILGRFLETQLHKRPDRKIQYMIVNSHLDQFLTDDRDRQLLGFPPLGQPSEDHHDRN